MVLMKLGRKKMRTADPNYNETEIAHEKLNRYESPHIDESLVEMVQTADITLRSDIHEHFFLSLAPQPSLGLGLLHKIRLNFLEAPQQFSFVQGRVVSPTPNLHPGGPGLLVLLIHFLF
jgi:hypothetical protein